MVALLKKHWPRLFFWLKSRALVVALYRRLIGAVPFRPVRDMMALFRAFVRAGMGCVRRYFPRLFLSLKKNRLAVFFHRRLFHSHVRPYAALSKGASRSETRAKDLETALHAAAQKWPLGKRIHD